MITQDLLKFTISPDKTVYDALVKIEASKYGTLIVTRDNLVVGTITDGDIRKILIKHRMLNIPVREVMNQHFVYLNENNTDESQEIFRKSFFVRLVPVVDTDGHLISVILRD